MGLLIVKGSLIVLLWVWRGFLGCRFQFDCVLIGFACVDKFVLHVYLIVFVNCLIACRFVDGFVICV